MYPFRNHKAATAGIPEHQMIKVKFPNMQQLTKAKRHVYLTAKKHYPRTSHHNHKTLGTEILYVKNGGIQFHNALKSVICHIYTAKCLGSSSQNRHNEKKTPQNRRNEWKKQEKLQGNLVTVVFLPSAGKGFLMSQYVIACKNTDMQIPLILVIVWDYCLERTKGFFKNPYPKLNFLSFSLRKRVAVPCVRHHKGQHSMGQPCCQLPFCQSMGLLSRCKTREVCSSREGRIAHWAQPVGLPPLCSVQNWTSWSQAGKAGIFHKAAAFLSC